MSAEPVRRTADLVGDPTAGDESAAFIREAQRAERAEEIALLRRYMDGIVIFAAGPSNVALQLSWPEVGYGVVESKVDSGSIMKRPVKRFRTTVAYIGVVLLGSHQQRVDYRQAINGQHRQVRSTPESPVKYNAFNRDLQLWVASCLYYGSLDAIMKMHGSLTREEEVILLRAGARFGTTLQVPAEMWHRTPEDFWAYWHAGLERAEIDDRVGNFLRALLRFELLPFPLDRTLGRFFQWLNIGFIPTPIQQKLGLDWSDRDERRHRRLLRTLGTVSRPFPHALRAFPVNAMMLNLEIRRRLGKPLV